MDGSIGLIALARRGTASPKFYYSTVNTPNLCPSRPSDIVERDSNTHGICHPNKLILIRLAQIGNE